MRTTRTYWVPLMALGVLLVGGRTLAQEEPPAPAKDEKPAEAAPAKEPAPSPDAAPAKEPAPPADAAPAKEAPAAEAAPAKETAPAAGAAAAAHAGGAAAAAAPAAKALGASAKAFGPLAESYKKAYDDMQAFMASVDGHMGPADEKVAGLQAQIAKNETDATQAKLAGDDKKAKSLLSENKKLKTDLSEAMRNVTNARGDFVKQAAQKVKVNDAATDAALEQLKK